MTRPFLIAILFIIQPVGASLLSDNALRMIQIGNEVGSSAVVKSGQDLLLKGMLKWNDLDAAYEASKQARSGNAFMGYPPQVNIANTILKKLFEQGYDAAIYDSALYLLDGDSGFVKDRLLALNLLEQSTRTHANAQSAFAAAVIRNESLTLVMKDKQRIDELIAYAVLNNVRGAEYYRTHYIDNKYQQKLKVKNWRNWFIQQ
jgi:hypothetical protein